MKLLYVTSEAYPFCKTGGLADVAGSLPPALAAEGVETAVILPLYDKIGPQWREKMPFRRYIYVDLGWRHEYCGLFSLHDRGVTWYFVDNEKYFRRGRLYGEFDDGERFAFFSKAVVDLLPSLDWMPDILHCNDWHTALAPVFLREQYRYAPGYSDIRTVFTIHNLKFQGQYNPHVLSDILGLDGVAAARNQLLRDDGKCVNYLAGAISYSDRVTTVSPTYAREICTPYFGEGLQDLFLRRHDILSGILNGIDTVSYDPAKDKALVQNYTDPDGKAANKKALQEELGLTVDSEVPLCVCVSRLTEQKGFDLLNAVAEEILSCAQIAVLGTGDRAYEDYYRALEARHPGRFSAQIRFSEPLSRRMYAGADIFLMPSRFEPCGLSQMISMRYGTVPVVRQTGGLADSVEPYNRYTGEGTGFGFLNFNAHELLFTTQEACRLYTESPVAWGNLAAQGMAKDFSWRASALEYRKLYRGLFT